MSYKKNMGIGFHKSLKDNVGLHKISFSLFVLLCFILNFLTENLLL